MSELATYKTRDEKPSLHRNLNPIETLLLGAAILGLAGVIQVGNHVQRVLYGPIVPQGVYATMPVGDSGYQLAFRQNGHQIYNEGNKLVETRYIGLSVDLPAGTFDVASQPSGYSISLRRNDDKPFPALVAGQVHG